MNSDLHSRVAKAIADKAENDARPDGKYTQHFHAHVDLVQDLYTALLASEEARVKAERFAKRYHWICRNFEVIDISQLPPAPMSMYLNNGDLLNSVIDAAMKVPHE